MKQHPGVQPKLAFHNQDRASAALEFAFSIFIVLVAVLSLIEICSAVYTYVVLSDAANEGLRYAMVRSSDGNLGTDTQNQVKTYAANSVHDITNMSVTVTTPDGQAVSGRVQVSVSYPYIPYVGAIAALGSSPTMKAYAEGRIVY